MGEDQTCMCVFCADFVCCGRALDRSSFGGYSQMERSNSGSSFGRPFGHLIMSRHDKALSARYREQVFVRSLKDP